MLCRFPLVLLPIALDCIGRWDESLFDIDAVLQNFFDSCHVAGPDRCAFYAPTPSEISANLSKIYDRLRSEPIPVYNPTYDSYAVVDYNFLRARIFTSFYTPYILWPPLAEALADLSNGDATKTLALHSAKLPSLTSQCDMFESEFNSGTEITPAIACNDAHLTPMDLDGAKAHLRHMVQTSSEWGSLWARIRIACSGWPEIDQPRFQGPIGVENTSFPILLIGNRYGTSGYPQHSR